VTREIRPGLTNLARLQNGTLACGPGGFQGRGVAVRREYKKRGFGLDHQPWREPNETGLPRVRERRGRGAKKPRAPDKLFPRSHSNGSRPIPKGPAVSIPECDHVDWCRARRFFCFIPCSLGAANRAPTMWLIPKPRFFFVFFFCFFVFFFCFFFFFLAINWVDGRASNSRSGTALGHDPRFRSCGNIAALDYARSATSGEGLTSQRVVELT